MCVLTFLITRWITSSSTVSSSRPTASDSPLFEVKNLDFGEVWENRSFEWRIQIRNLTDQQIVIDRFDTSCNCSRIEPRSLELPPGAEREIQLVMDLVAPSQSNSLTSIRAFSLEIRPRIANDFPIQSHFTWALTGRVRGAIRLSTPELDFGRHSELAQPNQKQSVSVTLQAPLARITAKCESTDFEVSPPIASDSSLITFTVNPRSSLAPGVYEGRILFTPVTLSEEELPRTALPVRIVILNDVQPTPNRILLGIRQLGETITESVELRSLTGALFSTSA